MKDGSTVKVHYTGRLEDGTVFDTSEGREPFEFTLGRGMVIPGFEKAVKSIEVGQTKTATVPVDEAYGAHRSELVAVVDRSMLPGGLKIEVGRRLKMQQANGEWVTVVITDVSEGTITVDANHPLAGKNLIFDIELVEVS